MRTGSLICLRVRTRLCVSVLGGKQSIYFSRFRKYLGIFGVFVKQIVLLNIVFGFAVLVSIWEHGLKTVSTFVQKLSKNVPEVWTILVRNIWGIFLEFLAPLASVLSASEAAKQLQPNARYPRRKNSSFQGHVRNLAGGNVGTDARIINCCHICSCLHSIKTSVPFG